MEQAASIIDRRDHIEKGLLAKFGEAFEKAAEQARAITDPALRALGAARIALEHAVLQTAVEKEMPPKEVTAMLERLRRNRSRTSFGRGERASSDTTASSRTRW